MIGSYKVYEDKNGEGHLRYIDTVRTDASWKAVEVAYTENAHMISPPIVKADLFAQHIPDTEEM